MKKVTRADAKKKIEELTGVKIEQTSQDLKTFIFDEDEVIKNKVFTSHQLNKDTFGYGMLLPRWEDILDKENKITGQKQVWRPVVITSNKRGVVISKFMMNEYKIKYPEIPYEMKLKWKLKFIENYLRKDPQIIKGIELFNKVKEQYGYYCFYRTKEWYDINTLWDLGTYFHQLFSSFPLKEERGIAGSGKTKSMVVSSQMTLNATEIMTNPSEATLFRETDLMRPTKYFDEAEKLFRWVKGNIEPDDRVELINASYSRNGVVPRQERIGSKFITKWYHVYSPTRLSSINGLYGATETRAITQIHTKSPDEDLRGERDPEDDNNKSKWNEIRNECYLFGLQNWKLVYDEYVNFDEKTTLKKRDLQIWKPLLVLAKIIDKEKLFPEIISFAEKISKQRKNDLLSEGTLDYKFLFCLNDLLLKADSERIYVNKIREKYNFIYKQSEPTNIGYNKSISTHLDKLGFKELRDKDMHGSYYQLTKKIFDEIISPITNEFSSDTSYSSYNKGKEENKHDEPMMNNDEYNKNNKNKHDEYDGNDGYDDYTRDVDKIEVVKMKSLGNKNATL